MTSVWVFNGDNTIPSGVFTTREIAEGWIQQHRLTGLLTEYPLDTGIYEWAMNQGFFTPKYPSHHEPQFIGRFSSAHLQHYHYEDGAQCG